MKIAEFPATATATLKASLDTFLSGLGRRRLIEAGVAPESLQACGALAEARLETQDLPSFLTATGEELDAFFGFLRVFLIAGDRLLGGATFARNAMGDYVFEHVSLRASTVLADALEAAEALPDSAAIEARLLSVPPLYLRALVFVRDGEVESFTVLSPPYSTGVTTRTPEAFLRFVASL